MNSVLIDTNVLVYAKDISSIYHAWAIEAINGRYSKYTTIKTLTEYFAVTTKVNYNLLSAKEATFDIIEFMNLFQILYPSTVSVGILIELINKYSPIGPRIHDFEIASIGLASEIDTIITVNSRDFKMVGEISIIHP